MNRNLRKRGAVEMSLNLIIMLIIGIVVLGLVIGFVNSLVNRGQETYFSQLSDNDIQKLEEVRRCSANLCMIPDPAMSVTLGSSERVFMKVRAFAGDISCLPGNLDSCAEVSYRVFDSSGADVTGRGFVLSGPGLEASSGNQEAGMYTLTVPRDVSLGDYYMRIYLYEGMDDQTTITRTITVE